MRALGPSRNPPFQRGRGFEKRDEETMKRFICLATILASSALNVSAETLILPQGSETRESPRGNPFPFSIPGDISSQQIGIAVIVLESKGVQLHETLPLVPKILESLATIRRGQIVRVKD